MMNIRHERQIRMTGLQTHPFLARSRTIGGVMAVALSLGACASPGQEHSQNLNTCSGMGASYGSPAYTKCMLQQQTRGDEKMLILLEEQRMHQELGRPAREKLEEKRARREREKRRE